VRAVDGDRAAEAAAELIAAVILLVEVVDLLRERLRVERVVAEQREPAAAEVVGAALGDDVEDAAVAAAVLGLEAIASRGKSWSRPPTVSSLLSPPSI
jgi:hypothetical protein